MLRRPFIGRKTLTQAFGVNGYNYSRFNLKGHNGLDYAIQQGSNLYAPIEGKVIEFGNDITGYGQYIKIENDREGTILAHMSVVNVKLGDNVSVGQFVGLSGGAIGTYGCGNSTGSHLHWGYYTKPRDRSNGYTGYIDQSGLLISWDEQLKIQDEVKVNPVVTGVFSTPISEDLEKCIIDNKILKDKVILLEKYIKAVEDVNKILYSLNQ